MLKNIIILVFRALRRKSNETQPLCNLFSKLSSCLRSDNLQNMMLHAYLIDEFLTNLFEGKRASDSLNPDFLYQLINSDFLENVKSGISCFM